MFPEAFDRMMVLFAAGLGVTLLGCVNAFYRGSSLAIRGVASMLVVGLMAGTAAAATGLSQAGIVVGSGLVALFAVVSLPGSAWLGRAIAAVSAAIRPPAVRWVVVGILGLGTAIGSVLWSDAEYFENLNQQMAELEAMTSPPPSETPSVRALTDFGREIALREATAPRDERELLALEAAIFSKPSVRDSVIRCQPGSDASNCHGWVFTGGRYWISGSEVDHILAENGYQATKDPRPGDLIIYRSGSNILHTALVRYVTEGLPVLVEGKWGCSGIYIHPADKSVYGASFQYYRSARSGHLLVGMQSSDGRDARGTPHIVPDPANPGEFTE